MTTVAFKDGVLACDSRMTRGARIESDDFKKSVWAGGCLYVFTGEPHRLHHLIEDHQAKDYNSPRKPAPNLDALVWDGKLLKHIGYDEDTGYFFEVPLDWCTCFALGSGAQYAYGAMDAGMSAAAAVRMARKRDIYTGGKVRQIKLK